ncbi:zinc ribbon domain-containing protein [Streptomyces sp. NPDC052107]|uniref:zinc ribbon domain-containing protein n=1 Tax=Streptomyces sp. NPDC052107 TaxID=3155632 RepID=UPI00341CE254
MRRLGSTVRSPIPDGGCSCRYSPPRRKGRTGGDVGGPRHTSRRCPACGHTAKENRPTQETFHCQACGHHAHADTVGALNVLRAGLARRQAAPA